MSTPRTVAFHTLGCKLNYSETSSIGQLFQKAGYQEVDFDTPSDVYVINTCSVTDQADRKCRKIVRAAIKQNAQAKIVVVGCYAQLKPEEIASIPGVSIVLGASEKFEILDYIQTIDHHSPHGSAYYSEISEARQFVPSYSVEGRTRSFLKIQDGCDYKCSFCTIPLARGKSRSGTIDSILKCSNELIEKGIKEIVLTGVNIGDFGNGTEVIEGTKPKKEALFIDLIRELDQLNAECRFRISSIEPNLCTEEIIDFVAGSKHFMPHFHMPLQSGDNEILSLMRRRYKRELYRERVAYIKNKMPHACIGVDVITGFPGENDSHFNNTYTFLEDLDVSYLHVFTYSERDNTPAIHMNSIVPVEIRHQRSHLLRNLSEKKKMHFYHQFTNTVQEVLVENNIENGYCGGFSKNYLRINLPADLKLINQIIPVKLVAMNEDITFTGERINSSRAELTFK
jgi:threonylcarbamoyladenosine tRNA methylthiotransferase MtaB